MHTNKHNSYYFIETHIFFLCHRFAIFNQYRIPRDTLLNKLGDVTADGKYISVKVYNLLSFFLNAF